MSIASKTVIPEELKTSFIKVSDYRDNNLQGSFYNAYYGREIRFHNLTQLLLYMEEMMNETNCPEAAMKCRRFREKTCKADGEKLQKAWLYRPVEKPIATFRVRVLFRQGASWQGRLYWQEGQQEVSFRSALELIKLMDSAITQPGTVELQGSDEIAYIG